MFKDYFGEQMWDNIAITISVIGMTSLPLLDFLGYI